MKSTRERAWGGILYVNTRALEIAPVQQHSKSDTHLLSSWPSKEETEKPLVAAIETAADTSSF